MRVGAGLLVLVLVAGCFSSTPQELPPTIEPDTSPATRLLAIGDPGTGQEAQYRVAQAMHGVCEARGCDAVIVAGDNIYEAGVTSPYDPQFELKFEEPYAAFGIPFYMSLGNHDKGNINSDVVGGFQVQYAQRTDRSSERWQMPGMWYNASVGGVALLALDTNLAGGPLGGQEEGSDQLAWFEEQPAGQGWRVAFGHHPLFSYGAHGDAAQESQARAAFLEQTVCGGVDVYVAGHDHDLQVLEARPGCGDTRFLVSGAAGKTRSLATEPEGMDWAVGDTYGFMWLEFAGDALQIVVFDDAGAVLHERMWSR